MVRTREGGAAPHGTPDEPSPGADASSSVKVRLGNGDGTFGGETSGRLDIITPCDTFGALFARCVR